MWFSAGLYFGRTPAGLTVTRASTAYASTAAGVWSPFSSGVARITDLGLWVEEARTNSARNNSMQGVVAGSPGTRPTNWGVFSIAGLTQTIVGTGTQNGIDYIEINFTGTSSGTEVAMPFETATGVAATSGQTWTASAFVSLVGGSLTNVSSIYLRHNECDSGGAGIADQNGTDFKASLTTTLNRFIYTATLANASTAFDRPIVIVSFNNGVALNFTLRIGWPQLELGAFATSPIRTTTAAATRAADVITLTTAPTFGSAYSVYGQATPFSPTTNASSQLITTISDGTVNNRLIIYRNTGVSAGGNTSGGSATAVGPFAAWSQNVSGKIALATTNGDQAMSFNASAVGTGAGSLPIGVNAVSIGSTQAFSLQWNGYISRIAIWPTTRISNAQLQSITT